MTPMLFVLMALATWRLASLFANEPGPFWTFKHIRRRVRTLCRTRRFFKRFHLYDGLTCEWCNSIWFGTLLTLALEPWLRLPVPELVTTPLALSAFAIAFKYALQKFDGYP